MATLRRFTKNDWDGFAGATHFADGADPLIAYIKIAFPEAQYDAVLVVDGEGIAVMACDDAGIEIGLWANHKIPVHEAVLLGATLPAVVSPETLVAAGLEDHS